MKNLALAFLDETGGSLDEYDALCGELADALIHWYGEGRVDILYISPRFDEDVIETEHEPFGWAYHMVAVIDGLVHDAWYPDLILLPDEYVQSAFPGQQLKYSVRK